MFGKGKPEGNANIGRGKCKSGKLMQISEAVMQMWERVMQLWEKVMHVRETWATRPCHYHDYPHLELSGSSSLTIYN